MLYPQLDPQCREATTTSPGRFIAPSWLAISPALASDSSGTKLTPGWSKVAAQLDGMPLDAMPYEAITTRLLSSMVTIAGRRASSASDPAPTARRPVSDSALRVSASP